MNNVDKKVLMLEYDGALDILKEGIDTFLVNYKGMADRVEDAIKNKKGQELEHAAHSLKGALKNFYVNKAANHAYECEKAGKEEAFEKAEENFTELKKLLSEIEAELKKIVGEL